MMPLRCVRWVRLPAAVVPLILAACTGSLFKSKEPPQSTYLLTVAPISAAGGPQAPQAPSLPATDLTILRPQIRPGLDTRYIAVLYPDRRLDHYAGARWSGMLDVVLQDLALQAFRSDGRVGNVHTDASAFGTGDWLEIDVADFQAEYADSAGAAGSRPPIVHVHFVARLGASGDRHVIGRFEADVHEAAAENRLTAVVDAYDRAASEAFAKIVAETVQTLDAPSSRP
jgi:ABC-type uncharacterized transport system auxiliary subunit